MGQPIEQYAPAPEPPPASSCEPAAPPACEPVTPPEASPHAEASDTSLSIDLTGLLSSLSNISVNGEVGLTLPQVSVDLSSGASQSDSNGGEACADDVSGSTSGGISIDVGTSASTDGSVMPILSLDSETDGVIHVPLLGENGLFGGIGGTADFGSLLNAAMLDVGNVDSMSSVIGGDIYDGNVPLAGDLSSALGSTLDLLTTTSSLFDVPALDILGGDGLDG